MNSATLLTTPSVRIRAHLHISFIQRHGDLTPPCRLPPSPLPTAKIIFIGFGLVPSCAGGIRPPITTSTYTPRSRLSRMPTIRSILSRSCRVCTTARCMRCTSLSGGRVWRALCRVMIAMSALWETCQTSLRGTRAIVAGRTVTLRWDARAAWAERSWL